MVSNQFNYIFELGVYVFICKILTYFPALVGFILLEDGTLFNYYTFFLTVISIIIFRKYFLSKIDSWIDFKGISLFLAKVLFVLLLFQIAVIAINFYRVQICYNWEFNHCVNVNKNESNIILTIENQKTVFFSSENCESFSGQINDRKLKKGWLGIYFMK